MWFCTLRLSFWCMQYTHDSLCSKISARDSLRFVLNSPVSLSHTPRYQSQGINLKSNGPSVHHRWIQSTSRGERSKWQLEIKGARHSFPLLLYKCLSRSALKFHFVSTESRFILRIRECLLGNHAVYNNQLTKSNGRATGESTQSEAERRKPHGQACLSHRWR